MTDFNPSVSALYTENSPNWGAVSCQPCQASFPCWFGEEPENSLMQFPMAGDRLGRLVEFMAVKVIDAFMPFHE